MKHFGKETTLDGHGFDSKKEALFYQRFIKPSGYAFEIHRPFKYAQTKGKASVKVGSKTYTPDFVVYENGEIKHIYDVKTSTSPAGMTQGAKDNIYWFQRFTPYFVEIVVPRLNDFKMSLYGLTNNHMLDRHVKRDRHGDIKTTSKGNPQYEYYNVYKNIDYDIREIVGW